MNRSAFLKFLERDSVPSEVQLAAEPAADRASDPAGDSVERSQSKQLWSGTGEELVLGQYRFLYELGRGAFGRVFKAQHTVMDRLVAIKIISPERVEDRLVHSLFRREVLMVTQLCHPNIVMAYDANDSDGILYLVLEYVDGTNLEKQVEEEGPLPIDLACEMMRQVGLALQCAHERGMVHRDIKPANLLMPYCASLNGLGNRLTTAARADGLSSTPMVVKVTDFGMARLRHMAYTNTVLSKCEKGFLGTPEFISPEQAQCPRDADIRADLYSLGCTFYYALTARPPFNGTTPMQTVVKQIQEDPEPLEALRPDTPAGLVAIIRRLMAKDPGERFQTPADLVAALDRLSDRDAVPAEPVSEPTHPAPSVLVSAPPEVRETKDTDLSRPRPADRDPAGEPCTNPATEVGLKPEAAPPGSVSVWEGEASAEPALQARQEPRPPTPRHYPPPSEPVIPLLSGVLSGEKCSPDPPSPPALGDDTLLEILQEWSATVEAVAKGADPRQFNEPAYSLLHDQLLEACRSRACAAEPARQELYRRLEALVEPWLTPHALALADQPTLLSLLRHCRQGGQKLFGPRRSRNWGLGVAVLAALATATGIGAYLGRTRNTAYSARSLIASLEALEISPALWTAMGLLLLVPLSLLLFSRALRGRSRSRRS